MEQQIKDMIDGAQKEVYRAEILIGFMKTLIKGKEKQADAEMNIKIEGLKRTKDYNQSVIDYLKKL